MSDLKRNWSAERLIEFAKSEGLASSRARRFACPARCSEAGDSASVSDNDGGAVWNCHRCCAGGSVVDLIMHVRRLDVPGALRELEQICNANVVPLRPPGPPRDAPDAAALWRELSTRDVAGEAYLVSRGLAGAPVRFNTGASSSKWLCHRARDGYRLALPLFDTQGAIVSLQLRSVVAGVPGKDAKRSLAGVTYPRDGVAMGDVGRARTDPRVYLAEGIADTLALQLAGVAVVGAPGCDQLKRLAAFLGNAKGREVVLCPQNDPAPAPGKKGSQSQTAFSRLAGKLRAAGAIVLRLTTPAPHKDPADWRLEVGPEAFAAAVLSGPAELPREPGADDDDEGPGAEILQLNPGEPGQPTDDLPEIKITTKEHLVNDQAVEALARDQNVYQRANLLVQVIRSPDKSDPTGLNRPPATPRIKALAIPVLRERLTAVAVWKKWSKGEHAWMPAHPPEWAPSAIHARGTWLSVRPIAGVVESPVLRPDGSVLDRAGYDAATELIYEPNADFPAVPEHPTIDAAKAAVEELLEVVCDFPFEKPEHRSAWLAVMLTPFARHAFAGPAVLTLIDANSRGAGKSLLADIVSTIFCGRPMARMSNTNDEPEMAKRVMSIALAGDPLVLIDNVEGKLGNQILNNVLTSEVVQDRMLGTNEVPKIPISTIWLATGNNVQLDGDTTRRTLHVRLATELERPEERSGFRHPDVLAWARENRPRLVRAALTALRAYCAAGRPDQNLKDWGSFSGWSRLIRHAIVWAGQPDPGLTREELASAADTESELLDQLIAGWKQLDVFGDGLTVRDALRRVEGAPHELSVLKDALENLCGGKTPTIRVVGNRLKHFRDRVLGGEFLSMRTNRMGFAVWAVRSTSSK
jgi:hypothetical protein